MNEKRRLYVDMDGTLAVFQPVERLETLYEKGYFRNLFPIPNVVQAVRGIIRRHPEIEVHILSAYLTDSPYALHEKNQWLDRHLPEIDRAHRIFVPCGTDKIEYIPGGIRETDCLLDDYTRNLLQWAPPARGIKLLNGINHSHGTWQGDRLRYDKPPSVLADDIVSILAGRHMADSVPGHISQPPVSQTPARARRSAGENEIQTEIGGIRMAEELKGPEAAARARLEKTIREFRDLESPEDMLKKAVWYDRAAGVNDPELTRRLLEDILRPEPTASIRKQDVIQTTIEFYDTKARAKRLLLVADTTENNEFVCFNITSQARRGEYPEAVLIPHTPENHFRVDSYVRCNAEYIIATDSVYSDLRKTPIRIGDADFARVMERYQKLKAMGKVQRVYNTVEPKRDEFDKLKAQVVAMVENYKKDPKMIAELVDFRAKFYRYSLNNTILIEKQNPYATYVASFQKWKSIGYSVKKGEHGIRILAPYEITYFKRGKDWVNVRRASRAELDKIYRHEVETRKATYFTVGRVFDISQTTCPPKDYPRFYNMGYESVAHAALYEALKDFALKSGFTVAEKKIDSIALQGYYRSDDDSITINDKMADTEKLATMAHEFAHGLMHKTTTQPTAVAEFEAECLAHMLLRRLSLPITENSKDYLATYYGKLKGMEYDIGGSFQRISKAYNHLIEGLDKTLAERGIDITHNREQRPEHEQKETPKQVNENFTKDLEGV